MRLPWWALLGQSRARHARAQVDSSPGSSPPSSRPLVQAHRSLCPAQTGWDSVETAQRCWDLRGPGSGPTRDHSHSSFGNWPHRESGRSPVSPLTPGLSGRAWGAPWGWGHCRAGATASKPVHTEVLAEKRAWGWAEGPGGCSKSCRQGWESENRGSVSAVGLFPGGSGQERCEGG